MVCSLETLGYHVKDSKNKDQYFQTSNFRRNIFFNLGTQPIPRTFFFAKFESRKVFKKVFLLKK